MLFNNFDICFSQNQETRKYLKHLGARKIKLIGNLKFSESKSQKNNYIDDKLKKYLNQKKYGVLLAHIILKKKPVL